MFVIMDTNKTKPRGTIEMNLLLSMSVKALLTFLCCVALVSSVAPQVVASSPDEQRFSYRDNNPYDAVQDQRMSSVEANIASLQKSSETQQKEIEQLIEAQSKWAGGLQALLGLIGFTSVVGLCIQIYEKIKRRE